MSTENKNREIRDNVGREKVQRAIDEVAATLDVEDEYWSLIDRLYEIGYRCDIDGGIDLPTQVSIGGLPADYIIDTKSAMSVGQALELGYLSPDEVPDLDADERESEITGDEDSVGVARAISAYEWRNVNGLYIRGFSRQTATHYPGSTRNVRRLNVNTYDSMIARTYYQNQGSSSDPDYFRWHWSQWRRGYTVGVFANNVMASRAQVGYP